MISIAKILSHFGKVVTLPTNRKSNGFSAVLATNPTIASGHGEWHKNPYGILVAKIPVITFDEIVEIGNEIEKRVEISYPESQLRITLPVFDKGGERLLKEKRRLFQANGVDTFYTWERSEGLARLYLADVKTASLICDGRGCYGDEELKKVDWSRHGLVFVTPGQWPLSLSLSLG